MLTEFKSKPFYELIYFIYLEIQKSDSVAAQMPTVLRYNTDGFKIL